MGEEWGEVSSKIYKKSHLLSRLTEHLLERESAVVAPRIIIFGLGQVDSAKAALGDLLHYTNLHAAQLHHLRSRYLVPRETAYSYSTYSSDQIHASDGSSYTAKAVRCHAE